MVFEDLALTLKEELYLAIPEDYRLVVNVLVYALLITLYCIITWKFCKFFAKRDIFKLNLKKYNTARHPALSKFLAFIFYLLEYIIITPLIVFFWFAILAIALIMLSEGQEIANILMISGAVVASVRMTSYYSNELSEELAMMFPLLIPIYFILEPGFFSIGRLFTQFNEIPGMFQHILIYLGIIVVVELVLRLLFLIGNFGESSESEE